jgi:hypothetical protein
MYGAGRKKSLREIWNFRFLSTFYSFKEDLNMANTDAVLYQAAQRRMRCSNYPAITMRRLLNTKPFLTS